MNTNNVKQTATAKISVIRYKDVRDKELLYLVVEREGLKVAINIGEKSYTTLLELINFDGVATLPELIKKG